MAYAAALSIRTQLTAAMGEATAEIRQVFGQQPPDLVVAFASMDHRHQFNEIPKMIAASLGPQFLIGCCGETVIGGPREIESGPALSLWAASLPGTAVQPFAVEFEPTPDGVVCSGLPEATGTAASGGDANLILLLAEPWSTAPDSLLDYFAEEFPGVPVVGGMASGGSAGENRLFYGSSTIEHGAIGLIFRGGPPIRTVVSQGCRPVGPTFIVTRADDDVIRELGGRPPLQRLKELYSQLPERDQELVELGLHLGIAMDEYRDEFRTGDFLISNVLRADTSSGAIWIGASVRAGQTVQFHLRDAAAADGDLAKRLASVAQSSAPRPNGALLFSCNGRGTRMFPEPHHDAAAIQSTLGPLPLAGIFAQGEFGPVAGRNYIHGFTASVALFP